MQEKSSPKKEFSQEHGEFLRKLRKKKGLTQAEFGESIGYSTGFISEMESGNKAPGFEVLSSLKICYPEFDLNSFFLPGENSPGSSIEIPSIVKKAIEITSDIFKETNQPWNEEDQSMLIADTIKFLSSSQKVNSKEDGEQWIKDFARRLLKRVGKA